MHILVIDDHPLYREGMKALLWGLSANVEVVEAASVDEALPWLYSGMDLDLVLLDMNLPGTTRGGALEAVRRACESVPIVVVSGEEDPAVIMRMIEAGAAGYIPKSTDQAMTVNALKLVLSHRIYMPPIALKATQGGPATLQAQGVGALSERQREVLKRLLQGKSNKVIARELSIAEGTVKAHLWAAYQVLGVSTRVQAMCKVHELGWLEQMN